jgi:beta-lactamase regulating signal transducer with metallopeptidase domain
MNRTILTIAGALSASNALLVDSAVKSTALLVLAAVAAWILRRDSAATRHLVWMLAMVAMLFVPVLSAILPQWRLLPNWAGISPESILAETRSPSIARPLDGAVESPRDAGPVDVERSVATADQPAAVAPDSRPAVVPSEIIPASSAWSRNWIDALPVVWAIGFSVLILRLMAARWMLRNSERQGTVVWSSRQPTKSTHDPIVEALEAASSQLGICRPVTILIHPHKSIPFVWGILRSCLVLPAAARHWSGEQLRSVLLHELAHVKRRDTSAQLVAQIACAMHWLNPLVWFAAWRFGVERERACDDLVLASGVRPSAYAGHLLEVVTGLSPRRWTQSCGLAMARKSSLEGRLVAVLSENRNRRGVSVALAAIALAIGVGIAVPISMLRAADDKPGSPKQGPGKPTIGTKLKPGTEEKLQWGEPVKGLRIALVWPPTLGEPAVGEVPDLFLAVQNVSEAAVRLCTTSEAPNQRRLTFATDGRLQGRIVSSEPNGVDATLKPREVVFLRLFTEDAKNTLRASHGASFASTVRQSPGFTLQADLEIAKAPAGAWTGKLVTPATRAGISAEAPKNRKAQELFKVWLSDARVNGKIPGGCIARLGDRVKEFVRGNLADKAGEPYAKRMELLVSRLDGTRDWQPAEASALLTDIAAVSDSPLSVMLEETAGGRIQSGPPLNKELENAPWGEALPNGLRVACLLEPRAPEYRLGAPLKMRIFVHNAGKEPVVFRSRTWHHIEPTARDAKGAAIEMESVTRFTRPPLVAYRLEPDRYAELASPGIGIGKRGFHNFKDTDIASWIGTIGGNEVTLTPGPVPLSDWNEASVLNGEPRWWLDFLAARLNLASPLPADATERAALLDHVVLDIFGTMPTAEETAAFLADREASALDSLAKRLAHRAGVTPFAGSLTSAPTKFRVLPAEPDAEKQPRPASSRGR